ncbi:MAG: alpha/beta hydrolase [Prevotellaceae bacterium]|nr:alpha/beta hydrolase [Prevotellaceae bacterium]
MWKFDILGGDFEQTTLQMKPDCEGEVVCTLVRAKTNKGQPSILYIHGFNDYFFQREMGERFTQQGYNFYALDLRKCGRSIRPWQRRCNMHNISEYYEDIDAATELIKKETNENLIFLGHSTGGLILSLYLNSRSENIAKALILNSPFLEMNVKNSLKKFIPYVSLVAGMFPNLRINKGLSLNYGYSIAKRIYGEWEFNEEWKPLAVSSVTAGWLRAIHKAHRQIRRGLDLKCPVLVMCSDKSYKNREWSEQFAKADAVLDVNDILKYSRHLGENVHYAVIDDGLHDLILSASAVRNRVYGEMFVFLEKQVEFSQKTSLSVVDN